MSVERRNDFALMACVLFVAITALGFSLLFNPLFIERAAEAVMPAYLAFLYVGILGVTVWLVLMAQRRRIRDLEYSLEQMQK